MEEYKFIVAKENKVARMRLFGRIDDEGFALDQFLQEFDSLENDEAIDEIEILINSEGGSVLRGMPIITAISQSKKFVTTIADSFASSMGAFIFLAGQKRKVHDYTQLMIHPARYSNGQAADETVNNTNDGFFNLLKAVTKKGADKIKSWMSKDTWFTAKQALENKLATEIIKTRLSLGVAYQSELRQMVASASYSIEDINNLKSKHEKRMENFYSILGLSAEASVEAVEAKIKEIQKANSDAIAALAIKEEEVKSRDSKITQLEAQVKVYVDAEKAKRESDINALVDDAAKNRQINAEGKTLWKNLLALDFESASKALRALPITEKLSKVIDTDGDEPAAPTRKPNPIEELMAQGIAKAAKARN